MVNPQFMHPVPNYRRLIMLFGILAQWAIYLQSKPPGISIHVTRAEPSELDKIGFP